MAASCAPCVRRNPAGDGVTFHAGEGVGTVTRAGLQIPPGEPAINPVPRQMMRQAVEEIAAEAEAGPGRRDHHRHPGRRGAGGEDAQSAAGHRRRALDPRHHRRRRALQLRRLDPLDPSRHRRGAGGRARPRRGRHRLDLGAGGPAALRPGRDGAARHGRFRRRDAEIPAPAPGPAPVPRRRLRQARQAGAGPSRPALGALAPGSGGCWRASPPGTARRPPWRQRSPAPTRPGRASASRPMPASRWPISWRGRRHRSAARWSARTCRGRGDRGRPAGADRRAGRRAGEPPGC